MVHTLCRSSTFPSRNCSVSCSGYSVSRKTPFARRTSDEIRAKLCPRRAECKARRKPGSTWHLDEMFVTLRGEPHLLWRAVDGFCRNKDGWASKGDMISNAY